MHIFGKGKKHYLEFLRNLTSQTLLLSFAFIVGSKLDFSSIDLSNWLQTSIFYVLVFAFFAAVFCNSIQLFEGCYSDFGKLLNRCLAEAKITRMGKFSKFKFFLMVIFKKKFIVLELIIVMFFLQIILAVIVVSSLISATQLMSLSL